MTSATAEVDADLSLAEGIAAQGPEAIDEFVNGLTDDEARRLAYEWEFHGRSKQLWPGRGQPCGRVYGCDHPANGWTTWALLAGRGFGKTWVGAHATHRVAMNGDDYGGIIHLIAPSPADYRDVMIEGPSGLMEIAPPWERPQFRTTKRLLEWPNGARGLCFCVTPDVEALTRDRGWVTHDALAPGDEVLGLDPDTGKSRWTRVTALNRFDVVDEPMLRLRGRHHDSLTTLGHRWLLTDRYGRRTWTTSESLATNGADELHAQLPTAAPCAELPNVSDISPDLAALVGWVSAEGTIARETIQIGQCERTNPERCAELDALLTRLFGAPRASQGVGGNTREDGETWIRRAPATGRTVAVWHLDRTAAARVLAHIDHATKAPTHAFLSALTGVGLRAYADAFVAGDGHVRVSASVTQNSLDRIEAYSLALTLLGEAHDVYAKVDAYHGEPYPTWTASSRQNRELWLKRPVEGAEVVPYTGVVWCPTTELGTWLARRNGKQFYTGNSAHDPEALRGPQCGFIWMDEPAAWQYGQNTFDMAQMGLRLGRRPRQVLTTTPKPYEWLKEILRDPGTHLTHGTTYENMANLPDAFRSAILRRYEGTNLGRQELYAEMLEATDGALWTPELLELTRRFTISDTRPRCVVAVDPAVSAHEDSDETGIVVVALDENHEGFVLEDLTVRAKPDRWARDVLAAYYRHHADAIVAEVNNGGDLVEHTLRTYDHGARVIQVRASRGKAIRAEPVAALFEQHRAHLLGTFPLLEQQLTNWVPGLKESLRSPDRLDAMVWGFTYLMVETGRARLIA